MRGDWQTFASAVNASIGSSCGAAARASRAAYGGCLSIASLDSGVVASDRRYAGPSGPS